MKGISKKFIVLICALFAFNRGLFADENLALHNALNTNDLADFKRKVDAALNAGVQINHRSNGWTVLHAAALESHTDLNMWKETIDYLIEKGANPKLTIESSDYYNGFNPRKVAEKCADVATKSANNPPSDADPELWKKNQQQAANNYSDIANYLAKKEEDPKQIADKRSY